MEDVGVDRRIILKGIFME